MGIMLMNSENSKTSDPHILLSDKYVALSNVSIYYA